MHHGDGAPKTDFLSGPFILSMQVFGDDRPHFENEYSHLEIGLMKEIWSVLFVLGSLLHSVVAQEPQKESPQERRERLRIAVQAICPVTGEKLGAHGKPIKMTDPDTKEVFYLCCEACLKSKVDAKHVATIRARLAQAQGTCLVMTDNDVSAESKHSVVEGQLVYVCCPPCIKKMAVDPEKFLSMLDDRYEAFLNKK